jgi:hypothetical protein
MGSRSWGAFLIVVPLVLTILLSAKNAEDELHIFRCIVHAQVRALQSREIAGHSDDGMYSIVNENDLIRKYTQGNPTPIIADVAVNVTTDIEPFTDQFNSPSTELTTIWNWLLFGDRISPMINV